MGTDYNNFNLIYNSCKGNPIIPILKKNGVKIRKQMVFFLQHTLGRRRCTTGGGLNSRAATARRALLQLSRGHWRPDALGAKANGESVGGSPTKTQAAHGGTPVPTAGHDRHVQPKATHKPGHGGAASPTACA